jgi:hypothetical protein
MHSEQTSAPETPQNEASITLGDVLRAVFLPQENENAVGPATIRLPVRPRREPAPDAGLPSRPTIEYGGAGALADAPPSSAWGMVRAGVGMTAALAAGYLAQTTLAGSGRSLVTTILYLIAAGLWLWPLIRDGSAAISGGPRISGGLGYSLTGSLWDLLLSIRGALAILALILSMAAYLLSANNQFTLPGIAAWLASIGLWMVVAAERHPGDLLLSWKSALLELPSRVRSVRRPQLLPVIALAVIIAAGAYYRFSRLDSIPNEMTSDHVEKLRDAYTVSQGIYSVFFTGNGGREALHFYLVALAAKWLGTGMTFLTLKIVSALEALALLPVLIILGCKLVNRETGYLAAALLAVSWWHVTLGRLALRIALTPLIFSFLLICLVKAVRTGERKAWIWAGVWMGVGVYSYQALRITPLVAVAAFLVSVTGPLLQAVTSHLRGDADSALRRTIAANTLGRQAVNLGLAGLIALAFFVPMLRVWHDFPTQLWHRVINRTTSTEAAIVGAPAAILAENFRDALLMFNQRGDVAWISAVPNKPLMDAVTGLLLVLGTAGWLVRLRLRRDPADWFVLLAGLIMLLPSALAIAFPIENPSATRASGVIPVAFLLAAWPLALLLRHWRTVLGRTGGAFLGVSLVLVLLGGAALLNYRTYFVEYVESYQNAALNPSEVAGAIRGIIGEEASLDGVWLVGWPYWHDYRAIGIEAGSITFQNAILDAATLQHLLDGSPALFQARPLVFILHVLDDQSPVYLEHSFPAGELLLYQRDTEAHSFRLFVVP